jgi:NADH:ubiquinone oxidoreductase subunit E
MTTGSTGAPGVAQQASPHGDATRHHADEAIAAQPATTVTVLSSLLAVHDLLGYLPSEALEAVAEHSGASVNEVWGVASFYPNFRFTPPARHLIEVCWGPTCHVLGAQDVLQGLLERLGLDHEADTPDGTFTLKLNTCLGVCPHAPAMSFDHDVVGHITLERAARRLDLLRVADEEERRAERLVADAEEAKAERDARVAARSAERAAQAAREAAERAIDEAVEASRIFEMEKVEAIAADWAKRVAAKAAKADAAKAAEADEPAADAPETDAPEADVPDAEAPDAEAPDDDAPDDDAPDDDARETDAPETDAPEAGAR